MDATYSNLREKTGASRSVQSATLLIIVGTDKKDSGIKDEVHCKCGANIGQAGCNRSNITWHDWHFSKHTC